MNSIVDCYIVYIRGEDNGYQNEMKVNGTETSLDITNLSENVEYMFAVQAVNDGGSGNITNFRSGIYCLTSKTIVND